MLTETMNMQSNKTALSNSCILIIEEVKDSSALYKMILNRLEITNVQVINNLLEIRPSIGKFEPNLIIVDVNGKDVSRALKILEYIEPIENKIPLIIVSAALDFEIRRMLRTNTKSESFIKPLDIIQFAAATNRLLLNRPLSNIAFNPVDF